MQQLSLPKSFYYVSQNRPIELSETAHQRLRWLGVWQRLRADGYSAQAAADIVKLPRSTLYRWQKRLNERGLKGLEEDSRRPKSCRRPEWTWELAEAVLALREQHGWDKVKLAHHLKKNGWQTSASTVGRILKRLKARGVLREPLRNGIKQYRRKVRRPYAVRTHAPARSAGEPKGYAVKTPGTWCRWTRSMCGPRPG